MPARMQRTDRAGVVRGRRLTSLNDSRRSGDETHPWLPNGDLRPELDTRRNVCLTIEVHESSRSA